MIIFKDKKTGDINQRIVTYLPDSDYVSKHPDISDNQIDKLSKDFNGYLIYKNWEGDVLFILKIKGGISVRRILKQSKKDSSAKIKDGYWSCEDIYEYHYTNDCFYSVE